MAPGVSSAMLRMYTDENVFLRVSFTLLRVIFLLNLPLAVYKRLFPTCQPLLLHSARCFFFINYVETLLYLCLTSAAR